MVMFAASVMNLWAMGLVAVAIDLERLSPWPAEAARTAGVAIMVTGAVLIARALTTA